MLPKWTRRGVGYGEAVGPYASDNLVMVMVDEPTGNKYMRAVPHKGFGVDGDNRWLVKDTHRAGSHRRLQLQRL